MEPTSSGRRGGPAYRTWTRRTCMRGAARSCWQARWQRTRSRSRARPAQGDEGPQSSSADHASGGDGRPELIRGALHSRAIAGEDPVADAQDRRVARAAPVHGRTSDRRRAVIRGVGHRRARTLMRMFGVKARYRASRTTPQHPDPQGISRPNRSWGAGNFMFVTSGQCA